ncbi:MAG TPA: electron transfer flavoprotein subunit beta/FixA family protein [Actinomycetota bacterium]|nr:electron transfer flavoprotein subunit beta/FixA family protein [Actinomycetota bacterium]
MQVVVLVKYVPEPNGTPTLGEDHRLVREGVDGSLDPGDEYAIEAALRLVDAEGGEVTLISMGPEVAMGAIRKGLSMGATKGVLVTDDALRGADVLATATVLAAAVRREAFDLVLAGVESTDGYTGTMPTAVAELLEIGSATFARSIEVREGKLRVERQTEEGYDVVETPLPALATVTGSGAEPRYPTLKGIMGAKSKPVDQVSLADLEVAAPAVAPTQRVTAVSDAPEKGPGEIVQAGADAAEKVAALLADAKVI